MGVVGMTMGPDGNGLITVYFIAASALPVHIEFLGEKYLVTGWDDERFAFKVERT